MWRRRLQHAAYEQPTSAEAMVALLQLQRELGTLNWSAMASLEEGLLFNTLGRSLKTTNSANGKAS